MVYPKSMNRRRRGKRTMKRLLPSGLLLASILQTCDAQTDAFTRQLECPNDTSLTGYTNVPDINLDMADELTRIAGGGDPPGEGYDLILCPGEDFSVAGGNRFRPVIDGVKISCGGPDSVNPECIVDASREQVIIEDSTVDGYTTNSVTFERITFDSFQRGLSVTLAASKPTVATFTDCIWQVGCESDCRNHLLFISQCLYDVCRTLTTMIISSLLRTKTAIMQ
jgi:hypothetical protein